MTKDEALKEVMQMALKALETQAHDLHSEWSGLGNGEEKLRVLRKASIAAIKEALAQPERSMKVEGPLHVICQCDKCKPQIAFNAEVVGYVAPQRTWVGLTDAEIWQMVNDCSFNGDLHADKLARAIEAAHGIGDKT